MSSVPYGSYFYGRSRYGTPGYHFAESDISGTAGVSQSALMVSRQILASKGIENFSL